MKRARDMPTVAEMARKLKRHRERGIPAEVVERFYVGRNRAQAVRSLIEWLRDQDQNTQSE